MNPKIGIVLSGGGARANAHIGVLNALNENGIFPDYISGSSAGALIGALYCSGYKPLEILELSKSKEFLNIFKIGLTNKGLTQMTSLRTFLGNHIKKEFKDLDIPLFVSVSNLNLGNYEIISSGNLVDFVLASCAVPLLFKPVKIKQYLYVDGGLLNNFPVEPLENVCDKIIGVNTNEHFIKENIKGFLEITERCLQLAIWNTTQERVKKCDFTIVIDNPFGYSMFSVKKSQELYQIGYNVTSKQMDALIKSIK